MHVVLCAWRPPAATTASGSKPVASSLACPSSTAGLVAFEDVVRLARHRPTDALAAVPDGRMVLQLQDGLELPRAKLMAEFRIKLPGFTDDMVDRLEAIGFISEIISWKLRLFVPSGVWTEHPGQHGQAAPARPRRPQDGRVSDMSSQAGDLARCSRA